MNEKTKDNIRVVGTIVLSAILIFTAGYCTGRNRRLANVSSASGQLEQRIDESLNTAGDILDRSDNAGALAGSINSNGQVIAEGIGAIQSSTQRLEFYWSEVIRAVEADKEATAAFQRLHSGTSSASIDALDLAIQNSK